MEINAFKEQCRKELTNLEKTLSLDDLKNLDNYKRISNNLFAFDECVFANVLDFIDYVKNLEIIYKPYATSFLRAHQQGIKRALRFQSKTNQQLINEYFKDRYPEFKSISLIVEINVGNVKFGNYFINDNKTKEPIEWRVLEVSNDKALLITKDAIDCKPYNNERRGIIWENCTLRQWLNNEFINQAFSKEEQNEILLTNISNPNNARYGTRGGNNTHDKIFLLSIDEAKKYFKGDKDRECKPTNYAKKHGAWTNDNKEYLGNCYWLLRSPGYNQYSVAFVNYYGTIDDYGSNVNYNHSAVRPVLFINL